jgi:GntR family transcriptional regulator, rspAB operon transcriptional repressor
LKALKCSLSLGNSTAGRELSEWLLPGVGINEERSIFDVPAASWHADEDDKVMLLRDSIYRAIRHSLLTGELKPGQELREQVLAERYGVSRSPVRDSLLRLEQENLVTVLPRQGYLVNPISISNVEDIINLRALIEPSCAAAAARADDTAVRGLDVFRDFADRDFDETKYVEYNESFHRSVADLSGNKRMARVAIDLIQQFERVVRIVLVGVGHEGVRRDCREHEAIIDAIQAHDADRASRLAREHAEASLERLTSALRLTATG